LQVRTVSHARAYVVKPGCRYHVLHENHEEKKHK
jgi:hypothetical protein